MHEVLREGGRVFLRAVPVGGTGLGAAPRAPQTCCSRGGHGLPTRTSSRRPPAAQGRGGAGAGVLAQGAGGAAYLLSDRRGAAGPPGMPEILEW